MMGRLSSEAGLDLVRVSLLLWRRFGDWRGLCSAVRSKTYYGMVGLHGRWLGCERSECR